MAEKLKSDFVGTGSMEAFCKETNALFSAINNIDFIMPVGYEGVPPSTEIINGRLVFDFGDALIFTLKNVSWNLTGTAVYVSYSASVSNGKLLIDVTANDIP